MPLACVALRELHTQWDELAEEERLYKKFKRGKLSATEYNKALRTISAAAGASDAENGSDDDACDTSASSDTNDAGERENESDDEFKQESGQQEKHNDGNTSDSDSSSVDHSVRDGASAVPGADVQQARPALLPSRRQKRGQAKSGGEHQNQKQRKSQAQLIAERLRRKKNFQTKQRRKAGRRRAGRR